MTEEIRKVYCSKCFFSDKHAYDPECVCHNGAAWSSLPADEIDDWWSYRVEKERRCRYINEKNDCAYYSSSYEEMKKRIALQKMEFDKKTR